MLHKQYVQNIYCRINTDRFKYISVHIRIVHYGWGRCLMGEHMPEDHIHELHLFLFDTVDYFMLIYQFIMPVITVSNGY